MKINAWLTFVSWLAFYALFSALLSDLGTEKEVVLTSLACATVTALATYGVIWVIGDAQILNLGITSLDRRFVVLIVSFVLYFAVIAATTTIAEQILS